MDQKTFEQIMEESEKETFLYQMGELSKEWNILKKELADAIGITRFVNWLVKCLKKAIRLMNG